MAEITDPDILNALNGIKSEKVSPNEITDPETLQALGVQPQQPQQPQPVSPQDLGFIDNTLNALSQRGEQFGKNMQPILNDATSFNPLTSFPAIQTGLRRTGGLLVGGAGDVIGNAVSSGLDVITPEPLQEKFKSLMGAIGQSSPVQAGVQGFQALEKDSPALGQDLRDIANMVGIIPVGKAAQISVKGIGSKIAQTVENKSVKQLLKEATPSIDQIKTKAASLYDEIKNSGTTIKASSVLSLNKGLNKLAKENNFDISAPPKLQGLINKINSTDNLTPTQLNEFRKIAGDVAGSLDKGEARLGTMVINKLDDFMDTLDSTKLTGSTIKNIGSKYREARQLSRRAFKIDDLQEAFNNAANSANKDITAPFRAILKSKKKRRGFKPSEIKAMEKVTQTGKFQDALTLLGKFGVDPKQGLGFLGIGAAGAGLAVDMGAVSGTLIGLGTVSKALAKKLTRNNAKAAQSLIQAGENGKDIAKAYVKSIPAKERSVTELAELLMRDNVNLGTIKAATKGSSRTDVLIQNSAFLAQAMRQNKIEENTKQ